MVPTNLFVLGAALYSVTVLSGLAEPWDLLARKLEHVRVRIRGWGGIFVVDGRVPAQLHRRATERTPAGHARPASSR
jgi:hypothetical protein